MINPVVISFGDDKARVTNAGVLRFAQEDDEEQITAGYHCAICTKARVLHLSSMLSLQNNQESMAPDLVLHHVGYAVKLIEPIAQRYAQRFGYQASTGMIHDPLQTAYVQFLRLPGETNYLELVAPDGPASKLTNAVRRGGGLNHLCYTCADLEQAILHLEQTGMRLISDPKPATAFAGRRICWLLADDPLPIELVERRSPDDLCTPGERSAVFT